MAVDDALFDSSWSKDAKNWAQLQLGDLRKDSQKEIIDQIAQKLRVEDLRGRFDTAFRLKLPKPGLPYEEVARYAAPVRQSPWIILIRYSSEDPIAMHPRLATQPPNGTLGLVAPGQTLPGFGPCQNLRDLLHMAAWMRENLSNGGHAAPEALESFVEQAMAVSRQELHKTEPNMGQTIRPYNPIDQDPGVYPSFRRLEYHQTGLQKEDDPYLSTSCVLPCLNASDCHTVATIRAQASFLGFYLVPGQRTRVLWPPNPEGAELLYGTKGTYQTSKYRSQIENSCMKMVIEREVAYAYPPPLDTWEICKVKNPNL